MTIISISDLVLDENIIKDCIDEMVSVKNKQEFFMGMVAKRLDLYNNKYMEKFDNIVDNLYFSVKDGSINKIQSALNKLSKVSVSLYNAEIALYKSL